MLPVAKPTNENSNGLLRQYFPKGTDLSRWDADDLAAVAHTLNNRPRKVALLTLPWVIFLGVRVGEDPGRASLGRSAARGF